MQSIRKACQDAKIINKDIDRVKVRVEYKTSLSKGQDKSTVRPCQLAKRKSKKMKYKNRLNEIVER